LASVRCVNTRVMALLDDPPPRPHDRWQHQRTHEHHTADDYEELAPVSTVRTLGNLSLQIQRSRRTDGDRMSTEGKMDDAKGRVKEAAGALTDDDDLKREGKADQAGGAVKDKIGEAKDKLDDVVDSVKDKLTNRDE